MSVQKCQSKNGVKNKNIFMQNEDLKCNNMKFVHKVSHHLTQKILILQNYLYCFSDLCNGGWLELRYLDITESFFLQWNILAKIGTKRDKSIYCLFQKLRDSRRELKWFLTSINAYQVNTLKALVRSSLAFCRSATFLGGHIEGPLLSSCLYFLHHTDYWTL